jgi:hypothetical protein
MGMAVQYLDDLVDIKEDKPSDGNLVHALLSENPAEKENIFGQISERKNGNLFELFSMYAPLTTREIISNIEEELSRLKRVSPKMGKEFRALTKFVIARASFNDSDDGSFYKRVRLQ